MRKYRLDIELTTGECVIGKAITTRIKNKQEFIVIRLEAKVGNQPEQEIRLDLINKMTALDDNAEFGTVQIN